MRWPTALLISILTLVSACAHEKQQPGSPALPSKPQGELDTSIPYSTREGTTITLHPSRFTFEVPVDWVTFHSQGGRNFHLSREQLARAEKPDWDEWDRPFSRACNAALPFDRCAAHVGSEGWGDDGHLFSDLQVRVYDLLNAPEHLEDRIAESAVAALKSIDAAGGLPEVKRETDGPWRRILVRQDRHPFDYSATANLDFRLRHFDGRTIVVVFMYTDGVKQRDAIPRILASMRPGNAV